MNPTDLLYIPDTLAMLVLMGILYSLRRQSRAKDVTLWLVGLSLVLLEALSADAYHTNIPYLRVPAHIIALASFVLAGLTFAWVARRDTLPRKIYGSLCLTVTLPLLLLTSVYGFNSHSPPAYALTIGTAIVAQCVWMAVMLRRFRTILLITALELVGWGPPLWFAIHQQFRASVYWAVACLYLLVAAALGSIVSRSKIGGIVVIGGFIVWAGCLFAHPFVAPKTIAYDFVEQIWTMQKFFVTIGLLVVLLDEERQRNRELALYDVITSLPNRRLFDDRLSQAVERTNRSQIPLALFIIDLNDFKSVNDLLGHAQGDLVLREAAAALSAVVRSSDTLARVGGDEFAVIVNEVTETTHCDRIADQLRASLLRTQVPTPAPDLGNITLSGSVGYALYPIDALDMKKLQQIADQRMYDQKESKQTLVAQ